MIDAKLGLETLSLTVLLTRPEADSKRLEAKLEALGYAVLIEPLLVIEPVPHATLELDGIQALILTSAHAVSALTDQAKAYPIYVVGEATASAARAAGCRQVHVAGGDAEKLSQLIIENCRSRDGAVLHLSGEIIREGMAATLKQHGFDYRREPVYRAKARTSFSNHVIGAWRCRSIAAVMLFSPRTSAILVDLLERHGLGGHVDKTTAICLSEAAAAPCRDIAWKDILQANQPTSQALIGALVGSITIC